MIEDFECCFDDDFVRRNLRFLLEDDMQNSQNTNNSFVDLSNESKYFIDFTFIITFRS